MSLLIDSLIPLNWQAWQPLLWFLYTPVGYFLSKKLIKWWCKWICGLHGFLQLQWALTSWWAVDHLTHFKALPHTWQLCSPILQHSQAFKMKHKRRPTKPRAKSSKIYDLVYHKPYFKAFHPQQTYHGIRSTHTTRHPHQDKRLCHPLHTPNSRQMPCSYGMYTEHQPAP